MKPLADIKDIVSDLDGVFFDGARIQEGAADFVDTVRDRRKGKITFASNGAGGSGAIVQKFADAGIEVNEFDIVTAGKAMALRLQQLQSQCKDDFRVLFLGPAELRVECMRLGVGNFVTQEEVWDSERYKWIARRDPTHVVTARHSFGNATIEAAAAAIRRGGQWLATGDDHGVTTETSGDLRCGTGTLVAAIQMLLKTSEGYEDAAPQLTGKPSPVIVRACLARMGVAPESAAMLGDSLDTDMPVAKQLGMTRLLVLSGVTGKNLAAQNRGKFDHVFQDIRALTEVLKSTA